MTAAERPRCRLRIIDRCEEQMRQKRMSSPVTAPIRNAGGPRSCRLSPAQRCGPTAIATSFRMGRFRREGDTRHGERATGRAVNLNDRSRSVSRLCQLVSCRAERTSPRPAALDSTAFAPHRTLDRAGVSISTGWIPVLRDQIRSAPTVRLFQRLAARLNGGLPSYGHRL